MGLLRPKSLCRIPRLLTPVFSVSKDVIELEGIVEEAYPNAQFRVRVTSEQFKDKNLVLLCTLAGRMRVHRVRILPGDKVKLEMTPYDLEKGRITYRFNPFNPNNPSAPQPSASTPPSATPAQ